MVSFTKKIVQKTESGLSPLAGMAVPVTDSILTGRQIYASLLPVDRREI